MPVNIKKCRCIQNLCEAEFYPGTRWNLKPIVLTTRRKVALWRSRLRNRPKEAIPYAVVFYIWILMALQISSAAECALHSTWTALPALVLRQNVYFSYVCTLSHATRTLLFKAEPKNLGSISVPVASLVSLFCKELEPLPSLQVFKGMRSVYSKALLDGRGLNVT